MLKGPPTCVSDQVAPPSCEWRNQRSVVSSESPGTSLRKSKYVTPTVPAEVTATVAWNAWVVSTATGAGTLQVRPPSADLANRICADAGDSTRCHAAYRAPSGPTATLGTTKETL